MPLKQAHCQTGSLKRLTSNDDTGYLNLTAPQALDDAGYLNLTASQAFRFLYGLGRLVHIHIA